MTREDFWDNREKAQKLVTEVSSIRGKLDPLKQADKDLEDLRIMFELIKEDSSFAAEIHKELEICKTNIKNLELKTLFNGLYDSKNCIVTINSGAGGVESCDWASIMMRMYQKWFTSHNWSADLIDISYGEIAGIKNVTFLVNGENAYGYCKAERGIHRLVRFSPFDSSGRRHTSFASVDVAAEIDDVEISKGIPTNELKIDTFRSGGKGGQNVNKVETAVRITHLPTKLVVTCQTERSQHQNRSIAMRVLSSKLHDLKLNAKKLEVQSFYGDKNDISWGNQIRSYVFQPSSMVKDLRTGIQINDLDSVLNGDLDAFVLEWLMRNRSTSH